MRIAERFGLTDAVSFAALADALDALRETLSPLLLGPCRTPSSPRHRDEPRRREARLPLRPRRLNGTRLDVVEIDRQVETYRSRGAEERRAM